MNDLTNEIETLQKRLNELHRLNRSLVNKTKGNYWIEYSEFFLDVYTLPELNRWNKAISDEIGTINYKIGRIQRDLLLGSLSN